MARLLGVRANQIIMVAFAISGFLAAIVAILFTAQTGIVQPRVGIPLVMIAFVGTVVGGLGSLFGAAVGGFLVGCGATVLQAVLPRDLGVFRDAFVFLLVILVLLARPQGLFPARGTRERV
jgi:branched-chain amino acid transport system permease protein